MDSTQHRLLVTAAELFAEKGFAAVSMRAIAKSMDITQAAIYHHFGNKEELYYASVRHLLQQKLAPLDELSQSGESPEGQLKIWILQLLQMLKNDALFCKIYYRELLDGDENRLRALAEDVFADMHDAIDNMVRNISPTIDSHLAVVSLMGMIFHHIEVIRIGQVLPWSKPEHGQLDVLSEHIGSVFINGLKAV
jgi:AcrR family transcriptional regulator